MVLHRMTGVSTLAPRARRKMTPAPPPDQVTQYALDVVAGRIVAGVLVRKACERHLADLATGADRGLHFDRKAAERAIAFFPLLRHYKGEWGPLPGVRKEGLPIRLEAWQMFVVGSAFGWMREDGLRRFRSVYLEVAKKNGKTLTAAVIALLLAFFDSEPGAEVYAIATKRDQAKFVWNDAARIVAASKVLRSRIARFALTLVDESTASFFRPLGQDSGEGEQGFNPHGGVVDELHVIEDRDDITNLETGTSSRRQPMIWKITTAGKKRESVWAEERKDAVSVVEGRAQDDSMLVLIYTLDEGDDPFDEAVWPKANPNLGVSVKLDTLREQAAVAKRSPGKLAAFLQLRLDVPTQQSVKAIDVDTWDLCDGLVIDEYGVALETYDEWAGRIVPPGSVGYGGLDLASVLDLTADVDVFRDDGGYVNVVCRFYCPEDGIAERSRADGVPYDDWVRDGFLVATPGATTDYDFVRAARLRAAERDEVHEIGYDKWNATQLATQLAQDGATMVSIPQTHAGLAPGWRELEKLMLEGKLRHGGHPILRWMAGNVEVETDAAGNQKPSKSRSTERIDGIVALDMAIGRMIMHAEEEAVEPWVIVR
jgi:phage terminase large subunit-like protein